jgi:hypothetical protein
MEHSPYGEVNSLSPVQDILHILSKLKVYYLVYTSLPNELYSKQNEYNPHPPIPFL